MMNLAKTAKIYQSWLKSEEFHYFNEYYKNPLTNYVLINDRIYFKLDDKKYHGITIIYDTNLHRIMIPGLKFWNFSKIKENRILNMSRALKNLLSFFYLTEY